MRIVVVGAGIAGLTAAYLLGRRGHEVVIVERAGQLGEVGAGIQISPNASRVLHACGLGDAIAAAGVTPRRVVVRRWDDDRELLVRPLGERPVRRWGAPYLNVYRPDLIGVLHDALAPVAQVRLGAEVVDVVASETPARVELSDRAHLDGDVVLGADGIHSVVRRALLGDRPTRFSGWVAYRALVPRAQVPDLAIEVTNRVGPDAHLVSYAVGGDAEWFNLVCVVAEPDWAIESWTAPGDLAVLRRHFVGWSPGTQRLLSEIEPPVFRWALCDRTPLERWTHGQVALLGDACHPMVPFMAQGACQAIEDAAVLDRCLAEVPDDDPAAVALALRRYERTRRPRASELQARSFDNATTFHLPDGEAQRARDAAYARAPNASDDPAAPDAMDDLYGHDASTAPLAAPG